MRLLHPETRLHCVWYNKIRALAADSFSRSRKQTTRSRLSRTLSTSTVDLGCDCNAHLDSDIEKEQHVIMGKSNKFDYTNRPNSGEKLGHIVGRDLEKEADKVRKDAERLASKTRKISISSSSSAVSTADTRDGITHALDIKLPGKQLGDEGACAMFDGLEIALRRGTNEAAVLLEDLNLVDNAITTNALARLAPIIELSQYDLKTLDLSNNEIKVDTVEEVEQWEMFLRSFKGCHKLRRIDLSGNVDLGSKALETLVRVYIEEADITAIPAAGLVSVQSLADDTDTSSQQTTIASSLSDPMTRGGFLGRRCGLRSIPYITLRNIGLTDAGALWLSYVIEDHHFPNQLLSELNATHAGSTVRAYQQSASSSGIDWDNEEPGLTRDGKSVLNKAERIRQQTMLNDQGTIASMELIEEDEAQAEIDGMNALRRDSISWHRAHQSGGVGGDRRASVRSIRTHDGGEHETSELESIRKKIQRSILQQHGVSSVDLWYIGLRIAIAAQILSGLGPQSRRVYTIYTGLPLWEFPTRQPAAWSTQLSLPVAPMGNGKGNGKQYPGNDIYPPGGPRRQGTYAATLTAESGAAAGEPELAITDVTNSPTTPKLIFKSHRKGAFSDGGDLPMRKPDVLALRVKTDNDPIRFVKWQKDHMPRTKDGTNPFRDRSVLSHLPAKVLERIALETVTEQERELLSVKQRQKAVMWGLKRANFALLKDWRKMADSSQVWTLLESIECLEYQRE